MVLSGTPPPEDEPGTPGGLLRATARPLATPSPASTLLDGESTERMHVVPTWTFTRQPDPLLNYRVYQTWSLAEQMLTRQANVFDLTWLGSVTAVVQLTVEAQRGCVTCL